MVTLKERKYPFAITEGVNCCPGSKTRNLHANKYEYVYIHTNIYIRLYIVVT